MDIFIKAFRVCVHFINLKKTKKQKRPEVKSFAWSGFKLHFSFSFSFSFFVKEESVSPINRPYVMPQIMPLAARSYRHIYATDSPVQHIISF